MLHTKEIIFPVTVSDRLLKATVKEEIDDSVATAFHIAFSDGFEDVFQLEHEEGKVYGTGEEAIPYAKAIRYDLSQIIELDTSRFWHVFQHEMDGEMINVWVVESGYEGEIIYIVFFKDYLRFALTKRNSEWVLVEQPVAMGEDEKELVKRVGYLLDSLL